MATKSLIESIHNFFKLSNQIYHNETMNRQNVTYRITNISNEDDPYIYFHFVGKNLGSKALPEEIMCSDFLLGFSKADIAIITHLGTKKELEKAYGKVKPKLWARIAQQLFGKGGKTKFMLKMPEQEQLVEAVPEEVMTNKEALNMLEGHEAAMIGYAAAENRLLGIKKEVASAPTCHLLKHDLISNLVTYLDEERDAEHTLPIADIFFNKKLLLLFNKLDQQFLSFAAGEVHGKRLSQAFVPTCKIVRYEGDRFTYQNQDAEKLTFNAAEILFNRDLFEQFSGRDRETIAFSAGEIHQKRLKNKNLPVFKLLSYAKSKLQYMDQDANTVETSFLDLALHTKLLDQFDQRDRDIIRFAAGEISKEKEMALRSKKKA